MPRVHHVKKANKPHPGGIEKGDSYYWWKFRYGGKRRSKIYPRASQLTQSKWSEVYSAQEEIEDAADAEQLKDAIESAVDTLSNVASEYEEAAEHFGGEGENRERADKAEEIQNDLECLDDVNVPDDDSDDDFDHNWQDIQSSAADIDWDSPC